VPTGFQRLSFLWLPLLLCTSAYADGGGAEARAHFFNSVLQAPSGDWWNTAIGRKIPGARNIKTVLPGVLYRGGGPGGKVPLSHAALVALCEAGFAKAYYLYATGFPGAKTVKCTGPDGKPNRLSYAQSGFITNPEKYIILRDAYERIQDENAGPIFVHCWNGYHASGEIAAVALMQYCGYSVKQAQDYWMKNQYGAPMCTRIVKYAELPELRITSDLQSVLCPR
jgi:hypothetical protein